MKTTRHQNVSRHEHKRHRSWAVQIRRQGRVIVRYFADRKYGGSAKALEAAVAFRDQTVQKLPPLLFVMRRYVRNKTGVVGITVQVDRRPQGVYRSYVATWPDASGSRRSRTFSLAKFGKEHAFDLAAKARRQGIALLRRVAPKIKPLNRPRRHR